MSAYEHPTATSQLKSPAASWEMMWVNTWSVAPAASARLLPPKSRRCLRAILADCLLVRPATFVGDLSQPLCIPDVHCFHAWNITAPKLAGIDQFLTNSQVFGAHCHQFFTKGIIQHLRNLLSGSLRLGKSRYLQLSPSGREMPRLHRLIKSR